MDNTPYFLDIPLLPLAGVTPRIVVGPPVLAFATPQHDALIALKNEIDRIAPINTWDDAKKITNPYEYVFLSLQKRMHRSIAATQPLSRSYFKMIELWDLLGLPTGTPLRTAHTAEGPGGFIEAALARAPGTRAIAMTLRATERAIPGWRKSQTFLAAHPTVAITYGADGTGNLYELANQDAYTAAAAAHLGAPRAADLYTADGGFDFSTDYNGQENTVQRLLAAEALAGLQVLRPGGTMVLKVFDTKQVATLELLWTLGFCFERAAFIKPHTSRPANSERYWVGLHLIEPPPEWIIDLLTTLTATDAPHGWATLYTAPPWSVAWLAGVQRFQEQIEAQQFANIQMTLNIIRTPTRPEIAALLLLNVHRSRAWCRAHRIPENSALRDLTDEQIAHLNLEEALAPFQAAVARTSLPTLFRPPPTPRAPSDHPILQPPTAPAWRSALPPSIRDPGALRGGAGTPLPSVRAPPGSRGVPDPAPVPPAPRRSSAGSQWSDGSSE
jgi:hypothetical protein